MRVLMISADRSKRGILYPGTDAFKRHEAYAKQFGQLEIIALSLKSDGATFTESGSLTVCPTNSFSKLFWAFDALRLARILPKPDVVTAQDPFETGLMAWIIASLRRRPLHIQVHTDFLSPEYSRLSLLNRTRVVIAGFVLRRASRIRIVSERIRMSIERTYKLAVPITVLPIFVDVERFRLSMPNPALAERFESFSSRVLVVSRLEPEKDVEAAIRVFHEYAPMSACLIIVGEGSEREKLQELVKSKKLGHRVFFEGVQDSVNYYKIANLVLFTSKYDGYGLVIAEALSAGVPVISTDVGAARELGVVVASSYEELGQKMIEWFQHGNPKGNLSAYPYKNFDDYVRAYTDDIRACVSAIKLT